MKTSEKLLKAFEQFRPHINGHKTAMELFFEAVKEVEDKQQYTEIKADETNQKFIALLELVLEDNYCLDNNHEIAPILRNKIEQTLKQYENI